LKGGGKMSFCELYREGFCRWQKAGLEESPGCAVELTGKIKKEGEEEPLVSSRCGVYNAMRSQEEIKKE